MAFKFKPGPMAQPSISMHFQHDKLKSMINRFLKGLSQSQAGNALLTLGLDIMAGTIEKNPVATGRSRAGWYVGFNALAAIVSVPSKNAGDVGSNPQASADAMSKSPAPKIQLAGLNKVIEITNPVVYTGRLEYGWSKQAPYGMLRITMQLAMKRIPQTILTDLQAMWKRDGVPKWTPWQATSSGPKAGFN